MADISILKMPDNKSYNIKDATARSALVNRAAVSGGTETSLVTTGEKYTWNNKSNLTIGTSATTAAAGNHTHNYAGSSSAGGAATSANKINTNAGKLLQPVYFSNGVPVSSGGSSIPFIIGTGSTAGTWLGTISGITEYYDGLIILYKPSIAGASTTTLNLNNLGEKTVYINNTTKLTTHFPVDQPILIVYSASQNSGCWMCIDNYWSDKNTVPQAQCETAASTAAKAGTITNFSLLAKSYVMVNVRYSNTAKSAITLNLNSKGAKPIYINGTASSASNYTLPAGSYLVYYDGTNFYFRTDGKITGDITGNAATATALESNAGSTSLPIYFTGGKPSACTTTQAAASGGTTLTLVTTGQKYTWNNKSDLTIGTSATTAAAGNHTHGNIQNGGALQTSDITIANGDKLIVTDSSDSNKIARTSISFDGSTATKALTQKGTWETFNNYSHPTSAGNKHVPSGGSSGQILKYSAAGTAAWSTPNVIGTISGNALTLSMSLS